MLIRPIPYRDPVAAFSAIGGDSVFAALLDSAAPQGERKGVSYIALDPFCIITATKKGVAIDGSAVEGDPFTVVERELHKYATPAIDAPVPFCGGAVGYFGYELGGWLERLPAPRPDRFDLPLMAIGLYDCIAAFDHDKQEAWILSEGWPETEPTAKTQRAEARAKTLAARLSKTPDKAPEIDWTKDTLWQAELGRPEVEQRIARIIEYICAGDIYQANFTQRFCANRPKDLDNFEIYRRLRALSPSPFAAFLNCGHGVSVASASPERFLSLTNKGHVEAHPIKGTRRRDADRVRDAMLADELRTSAKDHAENLMIVDLLRNDLSRVCALGSIEVPRLCELETFASVHHLVSVVRGRLSQSRLRYDLKGGGVKSHRAGAGPLDLLRAAFPGGSITGAPKIRAMEIIHELEPAPRGVYCGCLGWIGFDGAMDMSMVIRTLTIAGGTILAQAGGGIVADLDPATEYEESMTKLDPLLRAVMGEKDDRMA